MQDWIETPPSLQYNIDRFFGYQDASEVRRTELSLDRLVNFFDGYISLHGIYSTQARTPDWRSDGLRFGTRSSDLEEKWWRSFPENKKASSRCRLFFGTPYHGFRCVSQLGVFHERNQKWYDRDIDGRHFSASCYFSRKMYEAIKGYFELSAHPYIENFENIIVLPMPHACEPDDTPLSSTKPLNPELHIPLDSLVIGHFNFEKQCIDSASLFQEETGKRKNLPVVKSSSTAVL